MAEPRLTTPLRAVLREIVSRQKTYGLELSIATDLPPGTIYPLLNRLLEGGWVEAWWEDLPAPLPKGRPRRRYYKLTATGAELARKASELRHSPIRSLQPGLG